MELKKQEILLTSVDVDILVHRIAERTVELLSRQQKKIEQIQTQDDFLSNYVLKSEAKKILGVSNPTLYRWEKNGKIQSYGIGGKRYYKRKELEEAMVKVKR